MRKTKLNGLILQVSVEKEHKNLLKPVYAKMKDAGYVAVNPYDDTRFFVSCDLCVELWERIKNMVEEIQKFYPEAKVKLEVIR